MWFAWFAWFAWIAFYPHPILMGLISVFQVNDPKFMNFFITSETLALAVRRLLHIFIFPATYQKAEPLFYSRSLKVKSDT